MKTVRYDTPLSRWVLLLAVVWFGTTALTETHAQDRADVIWARNAGNAEITLDGVLDEEAWQKAERFHLRYGENAGDPGSGWKIEGGLEDPLDPTDATISLFVSGDYLYIGVDVKDKSVGGSQDWARWDGVLMMFKNRAAESRPTPAMEAFLTWWRPDQGEAAMAPGLGPQFVGHGSWAQWPPETERTEEQIDNWNAVTVVHGESNNDNVEDEGYTMEMRFNLASMGYDAMNPEGDVIEWGIGIWDTDYFWPIDGDKFAVNRVWYQNPWGNANSHNVVRIHTRPDVDLDAELPSVGPEVTIPNGANFDPITIDGDLSKPVWEAIQGFRMRFVTEESPEPDYRPTYPVPGRYLSGQFQPELGGARAPVIAPAEATIKWFFRDDMLYIGVDVDDEVVQDAEEVDRWDAIRITMNDREERDPNDHFLLVRDLTARVGADGNPRLEGFLAAMAEDGDAEVALRLKDNTVVNDPSEPDEGYQIEMALDLTRLGYPEGRGDGVAFLGVTFFDGDSFDDPAANYGTRSWWYREAPWSGSPAYAYMDPNVMVGVSTEDDQIVVRDFVLKGNYPNPFNPTTTLEYELPATGNVMIRVFDITGREVHSLMPGMQAAGQQSVQFDASDLASGMYLYYISLTDAQTGAVRHSRGGRMVLVK